MSEEDSVQRRQVIDAFPPEPRFRWSWLQRLTILLVGLLAAASPGREASAQSAREQAGKGTLTFCRMRLKEAREHFTFLGEPINPLAVHDLSPLLSDALPGPVAIDLAGTYHTNRYFGKSTRDKEGRVSMDLKTTHESTAENGANEGFVGYKRLGVLANGIQVLRIWSNGGGSGIFESLLLVRCEMDYEYREDGSRRYRVLLLRAGECGLGDRFAGSIKVISRENTILIRGVGEKTTHILHIR
jgi:hypothetical protein